MNERAAGPGTGGVEMEEKEGTHANGKSASRREGDSRHAKRASGEWPWGAQFSLAVVAMLLAALFLIGLPYFVMSAENWRNPGTAAAPSGAWTAMIPVLIGLTTMTISGIFVFMTFRIDRGARAEARDTAEKIAKEKVNDIIEAQIKSRLDKQWKELLKKASGEAAIRVRDVDERMEARYEASEERMEMKINSMDERIAIRFADADARIKERVADAVARIKERVTAQEKEPTGFSDADSQENSR